MKPRYLRARVNLKYEAMIDTFDWGPPEKIRLVGLLAQTPR
jgi:hypothetical protein